MPEANGGDLLVTGLQSPRPPAGVPVTAPWKLSKAWPGPNTELGRLPPDGLVFLKLPECIQSCKRVQVSQKFVFDNRRFRSRQEKLILWRGWWAALTDKSRQSGLSLVLGLDLLTFWHNPPD